MVTFPWILAYVMLIDLQLCSMYKLGIFCNILNNWLLLNHLNRIVIHYSENSHNFGKIRIYLFCIWKFWTTDSFVLLPFKTSSKDCSSLCIKSFASSALKRLTDICLIVMLIFHQNATQNDNKYIVFKIQCTSLLCINQSYIRFKHTCRIVKVVFEVVKFDDLYCPWIIEPEKKIYPLFYTY